MMPKLLRIATRKSPLALWQAQHIGEALQTHWPDLTIELVPMLTSGDKFLKDKLQAIGGKGLFVKELEQALLDNRADLAVHSMKDVPTTLPEGLILSTICQRHSPFDVLVSPTCLRLQDLPNGAVIGTTSLRRQSQLLTLRPDLHVMPLRGNIHSRMDKLKTGEFTAIILALAGLQRMNITDMVQETLQPETMLPACGQGALGIECRHDDHELQQLLAPLHDPHSALCVLSERRVNALLGGNCHVPLAVYCDIMPTATVRLRAKVATPDGRVVIHDCQQGPQQQAMLLADRCAHTLLANGAAELLATS